MAGLALCSVPPTLQIVGEAEDLPPIADVEIGLLQHPHATAPAASRLASFLRRELIVGRDNMLAMGL